MLGNAHCWEWKEAVSNTGTTVHANSLGGTILMKRDGPTALVTDHLEVSEPLADVESGEAESWASVTILTTF